MRYATGPPPCVPILFRPFILVAGFECRCASGLFLPKRPPAQSRTSTSSYQGIIVRRFRSSIDWSEESFNTATREWIARICVLAQKIALQKHIINPSPQSLGAQFYCVVSNNETMHHVKMQNRVLALHRIRVSCTLVKLVVAVVFIVSHQYIGHNSL